MEERNAKTPTTWDGAKTLQMGENYQPQLVNSISKLQSPKKNTGAEFETSKIGLSSFILKKKGLIGDIMWFRQKYTSEYMAIII